VATVVTAVPARDVELVQVAHLKERFELVPRSHLAEEVVERTNAALEAYQAETGAKQLQPGQLLIKQEGKPLRLSLLSPFWNRRLADGLSVAEVRRHLEYEQLKVLTAIDGEATLEEL